MSRNPVLGGACIVMAATAIIWCAWNAARPLRLSWAAPPIPSRTDGSVEVAAVSDSGVASAIPAAVSEAKSGEVHRGVLQRVSRVGFLAI